LRWAAGPRGWLKRSEGQTKHINLLLLLLLCLAGLLRAPLPLLELPRRQGRRGCQRHLLLLLLWVAGLLLHLRQGRRGCQQHLLLRLLSPRWQLLLLTWLIGCRQGRRHDLLLLQLLLTTWLMANRQSRRHDLLLLLLPPRRQLLDLLLIQVALWRERQQ
jgi:hypothetical protein